MYLLNKRMVTIFSPNFLSRTPVENATQQFAKRFTAKDTVVDIGCGKKPYAHYFTSKYIGVDPFPDTTPDIVAPSWDIPLPDASADGIILNQTLEHIQRTDPSIKEIYRILKPGGFVLITVPQTMRVHSIPTPLKDAPVKNIPRSIATVWKDDYYRFTKYGLLYLFHDFTPISLVETRTTFSTLVQQLNYFVACFGLRWLPAPFYFVMNILGILIDAIAALFRKIPLEPIQRFDELVIRGLTTDYIFVCQKEKK